MSLPTITLVGNVVADPELKFTQNGAAFLKMRVACSDRKKNPQTNEWEDGESTFLNVTAWRGTAEAAVENINKGTAVIVTGRLKSRTVEHPEHGKQTYYDVEADNIAIRVRPTSNNSTKPAPAGDPWAEDAPF